MKRLSSWIAVVITAVAAASGYALAAHADYDGIAPTLHSLHRTSTTVASGNKAEFSYEASDDSGISAVDVHFTDPLGLPLTISGHQAAGTASATVTCPGSYTFQFATVVDTSGVSASYRSNGTIVNSNGTGPTTHSLDLSTSAMSFTVTGGTRCGDITTPVLLCISRQSNAQIAPGTPVQLSYASSDDSGVASVLVSYSLPGGAQGAFSATSSGPGTSGVAQGSTNSGTGLGSYLVNFVQLVDTVGNTVNYRRNGTVATYPDDSIAPSGITGLDALDFTVSQTPSNPTPNPAPTVCATSTPSPSPSASMSASPSTSPSSSPSASPSASPSTSPSSSPSASPSPSMSESPSPSASPSGSPSPSASPTQSASPSPSASPTQSSNPSPSASSTLPAGPKLSQVTNSNVITLTSSVDKRFDGKTVIFFQRSGITGKVHPQGTAVIKNGKANRVLHLRHGQIMAVYSKALIDPSLIANQYSNTVTFKAK